MPRGFIPFSSYLRNELTILTIVGSGSVTIPDYRDHPLLGDPITDDPIRTGPLFEASWTHALHCVRFAETLSTMGIV